MKLSQALRLGQREAVSLVGGGGKTTTMYRLADELAAQGKRVVTTTTARIYPPTAEQTDLLLVLDDLNDLKPRLTVALARHRRVTVVARELGREATLTPSGRGATLAPMDQEATPAPSGRGASQAPVTAVKLQGLPPEWVTDIASLADVVIVEADGSRGLPLKAPGPHEPPVPSCTTLLVPLAGMDVLGQPLSARVAHRPERVAALASISLGQVVNPSLVAAILSHPQGGLKNAPQEARLVPLLNKVASEGQLQGAREAASLLLHAPAIESVVIGSGAGSLCATHLGGALQVEDPVIEAHSRTAAIVLAAGASTRYGQPKQLLPWGETTMLGHVVDLALAADEVVVVLGYEAERIAAAVADRPVRLVVNPDWAQGLSISLRVGLRSVDRRCGAALFLLADQPGVTPEVIHALVQRHRETLAPVVAPVYQGQRGTPTLFDRALFPELLTLTGDQGGRHLIGRHQADVERVAVEVEGILWDVDTAETYRRMVQS